jgi:hypothetical protein
LDVLLAISLNTFTADKNMNFSSANFISVVSSTALAGLSATTAYASTVQSSSSATFNNSQGQKSTITIARNSVAGASLFLKIEATGDAQMQGAIKVNGRSVANLRNTRSINLTSCLNRSACEIDITGTYNPKSSVTVNIYSTNNTMRSTLQSSGSGVLRQKLLLNIT